MTSTGETADSYLERPAAAERAEHAVVHPADDPPEPAPSPEVEAVVARWNPQGIALLRAVHGSGAASAVTVIGPADADAALLRTELARFEPRVELSEPLPAASTAVETTASPSGSVPSAVALILLDAGTTIGADMLGLIGRLRADGTRILLAMNGIHAYQDWRAVQSRNLELLAAQGAADLAIVPVSVRLAVAARTAGDAGLLDRSGLGALHAELTAAASGAHAASDERLAAVTGRVLADTRQRVVEQVSALRSGSESARLREERAVLLAGRDGGRATAMSALRGQLHLARVDLMTDIGAQVRALHTTVRGELGGCAAPTSTATPTGSSRPSPNWPAPSTAPSTTVWPNSALAWTASRVICHRDGVIRPRVSARTQSRDIGVSKITS